MKHPIIKEIEKTGLRVLKYNQGFTMMRDFHNTPPEEYAALASGFVHLEEPLSRPMQDKARALGLLVPLDLSIVRAFGADDKLTVSNILHFNLGFEFKLRLLFELPITPNHLFTELRRQLKLGQTAFAKQLKISQSFISKIERQDMEPSLSVFLVARKLAKQKGITLFDTYLENY